MKLAGELVTCYLFAFRLSYSGKAVHRIFAPAGQEAFFEGNVHALNVLGRVPTGKVRYDNLRAAVAQVLGLSHRRVEAERWTAFRSHYGLDSTAGRASAAPTRRAESRARSAGSAATTWSPSPKSTRSPSSTL
ncbi:hypothetical protein ACWEF9_28215 [Streptomyces sp. NPDC004980]